MVYKRLGEMAGSWMSFDFPKCIINLRPLIQLNPATAYISSENLGFSCCNLAGCCPLVATPEACCGPED